MERLKKIVSVVLVLTFIHAYSFAATTATVSVVAVIMAGESSISVDMTLVDFGGVSGSVNNRRFVGGPVVVSYFAASRPWTIRVYTANPGGVAGLIGVARQNESIPLKVWDDNYGPFANAPGQPPDEENNYFWSGYDFNGDGDKADAITNGGISEVVLGFDVNGDGDALDAGLGTVSQPVSEEPVWLGVFDVNDAAQRRLAYSGAELNSSGFPVFFGIDVTGIPTQEYRTAALTLQIINE